MMFETAPAELSGIRRIRTLGPTGTNCEAAARHYAQSHGLDAEVVLHSTLEEAIELVIQEPRSALLGCVVYPDLHQLVFPYLGRMTLADLFLFDTFNMVLAARDADTPLNLVASHPAPRALGSFCVGNAPRQQQLGSGAPVPGGRSRRLHHDSCSRTSRGSRSALRSWPRAMGFTIHVPKVATADAYAEAV